MAQCSDLKQDFQNAVFGSVLNSQILSWRIPNTAPATQANSFYTTTFDGPAMKCSQGPEDDNSTGLLVGTDRSGVQYSATSNPPDNFPESFTVSYRRIWQVEGQQEVVQASPLQRIDCRTSISTYNLTVSWDNGIQSVSVTSTAFKTPITASNGDLYFYYQSDHNEGWAQSPVIVQDDALPALDSGFPDRLSKCTFGTIYEQYSAGAVLNYILSDLLTGNITGWG
jgi:hypothetical protein